MSLIIATGSNQGDSLHYLKEAKLKLCQSFTFIAESQVYTSKAVDYTAQPDFFNQVLEFQIPKITPEESMTILLKIEQEMGRSRDILRGPRSIDLDIVFWDLLKIDSELLTVPHPRWMERSFVVRPLGELPFFQTIEKCFTIPQSFQVEASPL